MATIKDVAKLAGVSVSTVSNIINGKNNVSDEKYREVIHAIEKLHYKPNLNAINLKKQHTNFIALIMPSLKNPYQQIYEGVFKILDEKGYDLIIKTTENNKYKENLYLDEMVTIGVSGILLITCDQNNTIKFDSILGRDIPIVFLERAVQNKDYSSVIFDNKKTVFELTTCLLEKAGKNTGEESSGGIALITGPKSFSSESDCEEGFKIAISQAAAPVKNKILHVNPIEEFALHDLMEQVNESSFVPDYFITSNTSIAACITDVFMFCGFRKKIYCLAGNEWYKYSSDENNVHIRRDAIRLGMEGAGLLLEYIHNSLLFEDKQIVINSNQPSIIHPVKNFDTFYAPGSAGKINLLLLDCPTTDALFKEIPNFERNSGIKIDYEVCNYLSVYKRINEQHQQGKRDYDIFMIDLPWINSFIEQNYLYCLNGFIEKDPGFHFDGFLDEVMEPFVKVKTGIYTLPIMASIQYLFYRKELFSNTDIRWRFYKKYGIELNLPQNWTEFNIIAEFFTQEFNPDSPVKYGTCIVGLNPTGIVDEFLPRQWSFKGKFLNSKNDLRISSIENVRALNNLCHTYRYSPRESIDYWWEDEIGQFLNGDFAMIQTFASHIPRPSLEKYQKNYNDIGISSIPGNKPMLGGWVLGINAASEEPRNCYRFLKWAVSDDIASYNTIMGGIAPKKNVADNTQLQLYFPWIKGLAEFIGTGRKRTVLRDIDGKIIDPYLVDNTLANDLIKAVMQEESVEDALKNIEDKVFRLVHKK